MKRYLCWLAVLGVIGVPAVAAACWPMWGRQASVPVYSVPMYVAPPVYAAPPVWQSAPAYVLPPPRIETAPRMATPSPAPGNAGIGTAVPDVMPTRPPVVEPIRTIGGTGAALEPATPPKAITPQTTTLPAGTPPKVDLPKVDLLKVETPKVETPKFETPKVVPEPAAFPTDPPKSSDLKFPTVEIPKSLQIEKKLPPLELPKDVGMSAIPKVPAVGASPNNLLPAAPSAAPTPDALIPSPSLPMLLDAKKGEPLPSLTLPPDTPVAPTSKSGSISRSSPISGSSTRDLSMKIYPATGASSVTTGYRTVGFYNHTTSDIPLMIEGQAVKLPAKTYLHAQLAVTFTWSYSGQASRSETVPDGASGLEVVFRE